KELKATQKRKDPIANDRRSGLFVSRVAYAATPCRSFFSIEEAVDIALVGGREEIVDGILRDTVALHLRAIEDLLAIATLFL
ncbi:hypothetical protein ABTN31_19505, partial [Acinetobacter baumannii]